MDRREILYSPLITPPIPLDLDISKLEEWIINVHPQKMIDLAFSSSRAHRELKEKYPWNLTFAKFKNLGYLDNFEILFPQFIEHLCVSFDVEEKDMGVIVFLPVKKGLIGRGFFHSDNDMGGLRMYLINENPDINPLLVIPTKKCYETRPYDFKPVFEPGDPILQDIILKARLPPTASAFYLNNIRAVHAPEINVPSKRIAVTIVGNPEEKIIKKTQQLLERSVEKYKDYVLRWSNDEI
jgi:hypothetical protein